VPYEDDFAAVVLDHVVSVQAVPVLVELVVPLDALVAFEGQDRLRIASGSVLPTARIAIASTYMLSYAQLAYLSRYFLVKAFVTSFASAVKSAMAYVSFNASPARFSAATEMMDGEPTQGTITPSWRSCLAKMPTSGELVMYVASKSAPDFLIASTMGAKSWELLV
jgi:hypothetical protein